MWESPIKIIQDEMCIEYENECIKAVQKVGFTVEKEELTKALQYDRDQYNKGYSDGVAEYMRLLCEHCMQQKNECYNFECPFCTDGCDIINIAERMRGYKE
jgi:uncharacterized protein YwgA